MYSKLILVISIFQSFLVFQIFCDPIWNYKENGPNKWPVLYSGCNGKLQSPIDLISSIAVYNPNLKPINFNNYNQNITWQIVNTGTSIYGKKLNYNVIPSITGSNLNEEYLLEDFHFHWGHNPYQGSEHTMNGKKFPLEIHLIHKSKTGKIFIVGFFYELGDLNTKLDPLLDAAGQVIFTNDYQPKEINLSDILPDFNEANLNGFFQYGGSLAFPPCTEGINWAVFRQAVPIAESQLNRFYSNKLEHNFRHIQPLNGRVLEVSVDLSSKLLN